MKRIIDLDKVRRACAGIRASVPLSSVVAQTVKLERAGRELRACCPFHPDRSPSFYIYAGDTRWKCFGCGAEGDVLHFVRRLHGVGLLTAIEMIASGTFPVVERLAQPTELESDRSEEARAIWQAAVPIAGTPAEAYLRWRGLHLPPPPALRFARLRYGSTGQRHPVLVALVSAGDGSPIGIQRTYLAADGAGKLPVPKPRLSLGRIRGGAIRLTPARYELILTEGLEDALTLLQETGRAAWVAAGAGMLSKIALPEIVSRVVIGADNDPAGRVAARKAAEGYAQAGLRAEIAWPVAGFKDFNAVLLAQREGQRA